MEQASLMPHSETKRKITVRLGQPGILPPVFIASSMTNPPWEPVEMSYSVGLVSDEYKFVHQFDNVPHGDHQYKFRLGHDSNWMTDPKVDTTVDAEGNENNSISVAPVGLFQDRKSVITPSEEGDTEFGKLKTLLGKKELEPNHAPDSVTLGSGSGPRSKADVRHDLDQLLELTESKSIPAQSHDTVNQTNGNVAPTRNSPSRTRHRHQTSMKAPYVLWIITSAVGGALLAAAWVLFASPGHEEPV